MWNPDALHMVSICCEHLVSMWKTYGDPGANHIIYQMDPIWQNHMEGIWVSYDLAIGGNSNLLSNLEYSSPTRTDQSPKCWSSDLEKSISGIRTE